MPKNKKSHTKLFRVNLNEGFIVDRVSGTLYGAYQHTHAAVITVAPWTEHDFEIPEELKDYKVYNKMVAHFALTGWTSSGHRSISALTKPLTEKEEFFKNL
jgi:hypothetical protein